MLIKARKRRLRKPCLEEIEKVVRKLEKLEVGKRLAAGAATPAVRGLV
jgi:hypothetical protein